MNELLTIYPTLVLIYLLQCFSLSVPGVKMFLVNSRLKGRLLPIPRHNGPRARRLLFLNPFSCFTQAIFVAGIPFSFLAKSSGEIIGLKMSNGSAIDGAHSSVDFSTSNEFSARQKELLRNGSPIAVLHSEYFSARIADILNRLQVAPDQRRREILRRETQRMFSTKDVRQRLQLFLDQTALLTTICFVLLLYVFVIAPIAVYKIGLLHVWPALVFTLVFNSVLIAWMFQRAHRRLYRERPSGRLQHLVTIALSPLAAIRATDLLAVNLLEDFHPVAVAQVILSTDNFLKFAEAELREAKFLTHDPIMEERITTFLSRCGVNPDSLLAPPSPDSGNSRTYCPVCLTQYVFDEGVCRDCYDSPVHALKPTTPSDTRTKSKRDLTLPATSARGALDRNHKKMNE